MNQINNARINTVFTANTPAVAKTDFAVNTGMQNGQDRVTLGEGTATAPKPSGLFGRRSQPFRVMRAQEEMTKNPATEAEIAAYHQHLANKMQQLSQPAGTTEWGTH